jgi:tripartite-type tricarboxylate transporter receptor subunit TctC
MRTCIGKKLAVLAGLFCLATAGICADDYPSKPIKIVVGYVPSGGPDSLARLLAPKLSSILGQPVIVENKPGASGSIATTQVSKMPADGYTLLLGETGQLVIAPNLMKEVTYDPSKDLTPIARLVSGTIVMVTNAKTTNIRSLQDLIQEAKQNPGKLNYGSSGNGSSHHIAMEAFRLPLGLDVVHIPYKGSGQSMAAVLSGEIPILMSGFQIVQPYIKTGRLRMLGVSTKERHQDAPDVPSMSEFVKDYSYPSDWGVLAPPGLPAPVLAKLSDAFKAAMGSPDVQEHLKTVGLQTTWKTSDQYREILRDELKKYEQAIKAANIRIN